MVSLREMDRWFYCPPVGHLVVNMHRSVRWIVEAAVVVFWQIVMNKYEENKSDGNSDEVLLLFQEFCYYWEKTDLTEQWR